MTEAVCGSAGCCCRAAGTRRRPMNCGRQPLRQTMICSATTVRSSLGLRKKRWGTMTRGRICTHGPQSLYPTAQSPSSCSERAGAPPRRSRGRPQGDSARLRLAGHRPGTPGPLVDVSRGAGAERRSAGSKNSAGRFSSHSRDRAADARGLAVAGVAASSGGRRTPPSRAGSRRCALTCSSPTEGSRCSGLDVRRLRSARQWRRTTGRFRRASKRSR